MIVSFRLKSDTLTLREPSTNWELNQKKHLDSDESPLLVPSTISRSYRGPILPKGQKPLPGHPHWVTEIGICRLRIDNNAKIMIDHSERLYGIFVL